MLDMQKKMEQETRCHHMFGSIQTATPRETMVMAGGWGGGVEGEDETRGRWWAGSGRNIVRSWA